MNRRVSLAATAALLGATLAHADHPEARVDRDLLTIIGAGEVQASPFGGSEQVWEVGFDVRELLRFRDLEGNLQSEASKPILGNYFQIGLPGREVARLRIDNVSDVVAGVTTLSVSGGEDLFATLSLQSGAATGTIRDREFTWVLSPRGADHVLRRVRNRDIVRYPEPLQGTAVQKASKVGQKSGGTGNVSVLFLDQSRFVWNALA